VTVNFPVALMTHELPSALGASASVPSGSANDQAGVTLAGATAVFPSSSTYETSAVTTWSSSRMKFDAIFLQSFLLGSPSLMISFQAVGLLAGHIRLRSRRIRNFSFHRNRRDILSTPSVSTSAPHQALSPLPVRERMKVRVRVRVWRSAPPIIRLARFVAGEAAPKARVRVF